MTILKMTCTKHVYHVSYERTVGEDGKVQRKEVYICRRCKERKSADNARQ